MSGQRRALTPARALTLAAVATGTGAGVALQRRHLQRLAADEDFLRLGESLGGRPLDVRSADGTRLHAESFGSQDRGELVVLAHGWTEQLTLWGPVIRLLTADGMRVIAYDLRGHGHSGPAARGDYALERFGEDLEAVLAASSDDGTRATVVGHSLGAMSIAAWAERHDVEARANAVALINTGLGDLITGHLLFGEMLQRLNTRLGGRLFLSLRAPLPAFSSPLQQAAIRHAAFGPTATFGQVAFYERMLLTCAADVRAAAGIAMSDMDLWHAVERLTVPTLVVAGEGDRLTPPIHAERMARELPNLQALVVLEETGHMAPLERPDAICTALKELMAGVVGAPA
jgi:pimeloyl-ACP methyl ester carboxylesterase